MRASITGLISSQGFHGHGPGHGHAHAHAQAHASTRPSADTFSSSVCSSGTVFIVDWTHDGMSRSWGQAGAQVLTVLGVQTD
jgi:hypothetical protein